MTQQQHPQPDTPSATYAMLFGFVPVQMIPGQVGLSQGSLALPAAAALQPVLFNHEGPPAAVYNDSKAAFSTAVTAVLEHTGKFLQEYT